MFTVDTFKAINIMALVSVLRNGCWALVNTPLQVISKHFVEFILRFISILAGAVLEIRYAQEGKAVLFLIDEILSGTNSLDRRAAAEVVIKRLVPCHGWARLSVRTVMGKSRIAN